jgi:competence protein ComEC
VGVARSSRTSIIAAIVLLGSLLAGGLRAYALTSGPVADLAADRAVVSLVVRITTEPDTVTSTLGWGDQVRVGAEVLQLDGRGQAWAVRQSVMIEASGDRVQVWEGALVGSTVDFDGRLGPAEVADGVTAVVRALSVPETVSEPDGWLVAVAAVRAGLREAASTLPDDRRALVPALTLGDTSQVSRQLSDQFRATGLTHLMAVSGANLALLLSFVLLVARWVRVRGRWLTVVAVVTVVAFVALCRGEPSVVRSAAMGSVALAGLGRGAGSGGGVRLISVAVIGLCWVDPWLSRSWGFALSVAACLGIVWWGRRWTEALGRWLPGWLAEAVAVPLAAQVATQPLVTVLSGQVSVVGVPANAVAGPFVGPATVLGFAAAGVAWWWPWLGSVLAWAAGWAAAPLLWIAQAGSQLPGARLAWPASVLGVVLVVLGSVGVGVLAQWVLRRPWLVVPVAVLLVVALWRAPYHAGWPPTSWQVVGCDVGQGDATVVQVTAEQAILVDTGPDPVALLACLDQLGVQAIPLLVLSHYHADHVGGLERLVGSRPIGRVLVSPVASPALTAAAIGGELADRGIPVTMARAGQELAVGDARWKTIAAGLWLGSGGTGAESSEENNSSVVGRVSVAGLSVLVTGDIEPEGQRTIMAAGGDVRATVLKVPHHGSSRQDEAFLKATGARIALIEVGLHNTYGHPAAKTLRLLEGLGMQVLRTDQQGAVAISLSSGQWSVTTLR